MKCCIIINSIHNHKGGGGTRQKRRVGEVVKNKKGIHVLFLFLVSSSFLFQWETEKNKPLPEINNIRFCHNCGIPMKIETKRQLKIRKILNPTPHHSANSSVCVCFKFPISSIKENDFFLLESPKLGKIKQNFQLGGGNWISTKIIQLNKEILRSERLMHKSSSSSSNSNTCVCRSDVCV